MVNDLIHISYRLLATVWKGKFFGLKASWLTKSSLSIKNFLNRCYKESLISVLQGHVQTTLLSPVERL